MEKELMEEEKMPIDIRNNFYNKGLNESRTKTEKRMTKAEVFLWIHVLRAKRTGYTVNRQRPVLNCRFHVQAIEINHRSLRGRSSFRKSKIKDWHRQKKCEGAGFTVIRFTDNEVLNGSGTVIKKLWIQ